MFQKKTSTKMLCNTHLADIVIFFI
uniref:Uncharacterized protein n=1 Tax=Arundo donax TaxID=35708 RepID=A0A0A9BWA8_ARUDO